MLSKYRARRRRRSLSALTTAVAARTRHSLTFASAAAHQLGAGSPGTVAVPVGSPSRRVAHGNIPTDRSTSLPLEVMQIALRRRLRFLGPGICGQHGHGCRRRLNPWGDHALAAHAERSWSSKPGSQCGSGVGAEGHVVHQPWLAHVGTRSPDVRPPTPRPRGVRRIAPVPRP